MDKQTLLPENNYNSLVEHIAAIASSSKQKAIKAVDNALVEMNWNIGRYIV